ncbi:hypothetical protein SAMN03159341_11856 [Paenibacillus sp. 1_12]|nr:hypothetical protein SAMN03159341_11856 [Paenibacillus sp. 1_12]
MLRIEHSTQRTQPDGKSRRVFPYCSRAENPNQKRTMQVKTSLFPLRKGRRSRFGELSKTDYLLFWEADA